MQGSRGMFRGDGRLVRGAAGGSGRQTVGGGSGRGFRGLGQASGLNEQTVLYFCTCMDAFIGNRTRSFFNTCIFACTGQVWFTSLAFSW